MTYDDIVIGAGSSGAALAARLSEDVGRRVLLLEAGPDYPTIAQTPPDLLDPTQWGTSHDWGYSAEMVPGRSVLYPRGKVTGGSSAVNATFALRGTPEDYDEWAAWGNDEWSWAKVLPYFCRLEDDPDASPAFHGIGGPIPIERWSVEELGPHASALLEAYREMGFPYTTDHNDPESTGAGPGQSNRRAGQRVSTAIAYLLPARERANLTIRADSLVDRIRFEGSRVVGVELAGPGEKETVFGRRITLSAGAIGSPSILLRSGIGPDADLRRLGIDPMLDRPGVGANLIDHATLSIALIAKPGLPENAGPLARLWWIVLRHTAPGSDERNDMQVLLCGVPGPPPATAFIAGLMRPRSRGTLRLTDRHPSAPPEVCLNLASAPEDRRRLRDSLKLLFDLAQSPPLAPFHAPTALLSDGRMLPIAEAAAALASDEASDAYIVQTVQHYFHLVGTARMGPESDAGAVVDQYCRVHGVEGLRVVDASVMPNIPRANTNLTCIMIGERVADWMRAE